MDVVSRCPAAAAMLVLTAFATPVCADPVERWTPHIREAAQRFDVPVPLLRAVMRAESGGHHRIEGRPTVSVAGAMGLMQLMPTTWSELRDRHRLGADPHHPRDNILAGAAYLSQLLGRYGERLGVAAYHAGPGRVEAHLASGVALPSATAQYVAVVLEHGGHWTQAKQAGAHDARWLTAALLVSRGDSAATASRVSSKAAAASLFVPLSRAR